MSVFVGLDCGGSSSRVVAMDERGKILFQGQSGAANLVSTPENRLRRNLASATRGCPAASHVCGCFAGLINRETWERGIDRLREIFPAAQVRAEPDYTAALYASPPDTDVCVIAGTGSLVCSKSESGIVKSGGRGYILGDQGSGFHYGRDALVHFLNHPGSASRALSDEIERLFGSPDEGTIVAAVYRTAPPSTLLAKLVRALG
ncbi:MAG TPA: BadF/BadG/BcrA/BcrD ATPase family protein, partial [Fimbriimonas sp.]